MSSRQPLSAVPFVSRARPWLLADLVPLICGRSFARDEGASSHEARTVVADEARDHSPPFQHESDRLRSVLLGIDGMVQEPDVQLETRDDMIAVDRAHLVDVD